MYDVQQKDGFMANSKMYAIPATKLLDEPVASDEEEEDNTDDEDAANTLV